MKTLIIYDYAEITIKSHTGVPHHVCQDTVSLKHQTELSGVTWERFISSSGLYWTDDDDDDDLKIIAFFARIKIKSNISNTFESNTVSCYFNISRTIHNI